MATETPTTTPTPSATPTATLDFYIVYTAESTADAGSAYRIGRESNLADSFLSLLLLAILVSIWLMYLLSRLTGKPR